eukprot:33246-Pelagomonas_calceolata.AAC.1
MGCMPILTLPCRQQKTAKRYEDMQAGRYRPLVEDPANLDNELAAAGGKLDAVLGLLDALRGAAPQLGPDLDRVLCHVAEERERQGRVYRAVPAYEGSFPLETSESVLSYACLPCAHFSAYFCTSGTIFFLLELIWLTIEGHLDQGSPKIQGIEDSARLSRRCLPGSLQRRRSFQGRALVAVRSSTKGFAPRMTPFLN